MVHAQECCKAVWRVSRPMKKLRCWKSAKAVMEKNGEKKENGGMGMKEKNGIHKVKSQAWCPLRGVLHSP